ncbi:MAG: hypothetical protein AB8F65_04070 [Woeseiaceae bacterium]
MTRQPTWIRWLGASLALTSGAFIVFQVYTLRDDILPLMRDAPLLTTMVIGSVVFAATLNLLGFGWAKLIASTEAASHTRLALMSVFAKTSVAKYLPGNVMHYAGRQFLAGKLGPKQKQIAKATVAEASATVVAAAVVGGVAYLLADLTALAIVIAVLAIGVIGYFREKPGVCMMGLALLFFVFNGATVWALGYVLEQSWQTNAGLCFSYLLAWAGGILVLGAPGGIGVRESLFFGIGMGLGLSSSPIITTMAVCLRMISLAGDFLFYFFGNYWQQRVDRAETATHT